MPQAMLSLKPIITKGLPGSETPYALLFGVTSCISYHIEGRERSRWGSLQRIGAPVCVLLPATTQLLLPLFGSGWVCSRAAILSFFPKYSESADAGLTGTIPGLSNAVPFGIMGNKESGTCG